MAKEKKPFEWTPRMTAISVFLGLVIGFIDVTDRVLGWAKVPLSYDQRMSAIEKDKSVVTNQVTTFSDENTKAHNEIKKELKELGDGFNSKLNTTNEKLNTTNENIAYLRGILDRAFPGAKGTSWLDTTEKETIIKK